MSIRFSVIIPLYNKERYILRTIQSILNQSYEAFELIVVNDGSKDKGPELVKTISDSRIRLINQPNGGESAARNKGIQNANYEYVAFLDADDEWHPDFLYQIKKAIQQFPNQNVFATNYQFNTATGIKYPTFSVNIGKGESGKIEYFEGALEDPIITSSSVCIKKDVFNQLGNFNTLLKRGPDLDMWYRIARSYPNFIFINHQLAIYHLEAEDRVCYSMPVLKETFTFNLLKSEKINLPMHDKYVKARLKNTLKSLVYSHKLIDCITLVSLYVKYRLKK